ncbi:MAG: NADP-dependent oxidoreductase [Pseudomonadota bacterium]
MEENNNDTAISAMNDAFAKHWYFRNAPEGPVDENTLELVTEPRESMPAGGVRVAVLFLSLDATNRVWLSDWDIYMEPVRVGDRMRGFILGEVIESENADLPLGSLVTGLSTWSSEVVGTGEEFAPFYDGHCDDLAVGFGAMAVAGPTALHGLVSVAKVKQGDVVLVSAAAGAVGQLAGQIAKRMGCRTIGIAGGEDKCHRLLTRFAYDHAVDYKKGNLVEQLNEAAPYGVDVLFENVGGEVLDAGLSVINDFGRVVVCGLISSYNARDPVPGPYMFRNVIMRRLRIEGFVILDHLEHYPAYQKQVGQWLKDKSIQFDVHTVEGIDQAAIAMNMLYSGENRGKLMVSVSDRTVR